jgi:7-cyano-7-deazaguanine synthase
VAIGCNADDAADFPDCRPAHLALQEALAREAGIALLYPYVTFTKATIVAIGLGVRAPLDATWSCYLGGEWPCGECDACRARVDAFRGVFGALPR